MLLDTTSFESIFPKSAEKATPEQIEWAIESARDELAELVGEAAVTAAEALTTLDAKAKRLRRALGHLANEVLIPQIAPVSVKRQQDEQAGGVMNEHFDPSKIREMMERERASALRAIGQYLIGDAPGDDISGGVEYSHPANSMGCDYLC